MSATQFAWSCLGSPEWVPPDPKQGSRFGLDDRCWLCGGETHGVGWPRRTAVAETFTNHNLARVPTSETICQACVYLSSVESWGSYVADHPGKELKTGGVISWRFYSHAVSSAGHECPNRARWRQLLVAPPDPPFLFVIAESGQKHLLFRAAVAYDRDRYPIQVEEDRLIICCDELQGCLNSFEYLYALGFSKQQIASGDYNQKTVRSVGLTTWRLAEAEISPYRRLFPELIRVALFCAQRPEEGS